MFRIPSCKFEEWACALATVFSDNKVSVGLNFLFQEMAGYSLFIKMHFYFLGSFLQTS